MGGALRGLFRRGAPAFRLVTLRRISHEQRRDGGDNEIGNPEISECRQHADYLDQSRCHRRGDERAGAESSNGDAGDETAPIREPFHQRGDWNDVTKPESDATSNTDCESGTSALSHREPEPDAEPDAEPDSEPDAESEPSPARVIGFIPAICVICVCTGHR